jgi:hypothetical protein
MGLPIRIRTSRDWGTCFCVKRSGTLRFITVAHVLINCGCEPQAVSFRAFLCDRETSSDDIEYTFTNLIWDSLCDYVEFDCAFPGVPYVANAMLALDGVEVFIEGYLRHYDDMPPCDETKTIVGTVLGTRACSSTRHSVTVFLDIPSPRGLSGSPAITETGEVMFVFARGTGRDPRFGGPLVSP